MSNNTIATPRDSSRDRRRKRDRVIQGVKTGGDLMMYAGSAGLMIPVIQKAKENQNGILGACAVGAGAVISVGVGGFACKALHKIIDKVVAFVDEVKSNDDETDEEDEDDG